MNSQVFYRHPPPVKPGFKNVRFSPLNGGIQSISTIKNAAPSTVLSKLVHKDQEITNSQCDEASPLTFQASVGLGLTDRLTKAPANSVATADSRNDLHVGSRNDLHVGSRNHFDNAGNDSDSHGSLDSLFSPIKQDGYSTDVNSSLDSKHHARIPEIEVKNMDRFQGDLLPELGSETIPLSQLSAANGTRLPASRLPASQHSCRATGDGQRHVAGEVVWEHGDLISYRVKDGRTEVLVPWLPTWEDVSEYSSEAVARAKKKCHRERTMPATTMRETRKRKARGRPRRPLTKDTPPFEAPLSFKRSLRYVPE